MRLIPSWLTWYKKPEYRDIREYSNAVGSGKRAISPDGRNKSSIPSNLSLDRVLENKTCSPMSLYDFYMYLKHIEFSAENLEFYIWFKDYEAKWAAASGAAEKDVSCTSSSAASMSSGHDGDKTTAVRPNDFTCDLETAHDTLNNIVQLISTGGLCTATSCAPIAKPKPTLGERVKGVISKMDPRANANDPTFTALAQDSPTTPRQPEINAIVQTFLLPGSEKELNIPPAMRELALLGLQTSADPAHLRPVADHVYQLLRNCSHRNFVRLGVSNGTFETICVATGLGIALTIAGFLLILLRAFVPHINAHVRWDAFAAWPMWWLGMSLILSGLRGSCFFLLLFTRRQPLPWERFDDGASVKSQQSAVRRAVGRLMIFDRKFRVKDVALRRLQHKIVVQSLVGGSVFASLCVLLFILLPVWSDTRYIR